MYRKAIYLSSLVLLLVLAGNTPVVLGVSWDAGGDGLLWSDPLNWDADTLPSSDDGVEIDIPDANCIIDENTIAECGTLYVSRNNAPCYLNMTGGTLTSGGHIRIGEPSDSNGIFILSGGTVNTSNIGRLWVGYNSTGTLIITGGEMTVSDKVECGKNSRGIGYIYVHGGTLNVDGYGSDDFEIGKYGTGIVTMTGGVINVNDNIKLGEQSTGIGRLYLYGGTINASNIRNPDDGIYGDPLIDITEGKLILSVNPDDDPQVDDLERVNEYISNGWIIGYGGLGRVIATYDPDTELTTVTAALADPELAWNPAPSTFSAVEWSVAGPALTWSPGDYAVSHDVYFATDKDAVSSADNSGIWPEYKGNMDTTRFDPGPLELGKTYYWRIDEVSDNAGAPPGSPWKGNIWEFTVADYVVVDGFEDYNDTVPYAVYNTWKDGYEDPTVNGSTIGYLTGSAYETEIVHGGNQSVPLDYNNTTATYSEVTVNPADLDIGKDWTVAGVKSLAIWFYGDPNNAVTERMYAKLNNGQKVPYDGQASDLVQTEWQEWNIDLAAFGVALSDVTEFGIGFDRTEASGGFGTIFVDDIRLYPPKCMPDVVKPVGDLDSDCDVDYDDVAMMAGDWLTQDFVAVGSDAQLMNFPTDNSQWGGGALRLDGVDDWIDIDDSIMSNFHNRTIAIWVNISEFPEPYPYVFCFTNASSEPYRIYIRTRGDATVRGRLVEDYLPDFPLEADSWHHLAVVLRDTDDGKCTGEFYGDGVLVGTLPGLPRHMGEADGVNIGSFDDGNGPYIKATYDDFRIYDTALSENEIKYLAEVPGGVPPAGNMMVHYDFDQLTGSTVNNVSTHTFARPIISPAELYEGEPEGSRSVNFLDFAVLAATWLDEQLWP